MFEKPTRNHFSIVIERLGALFFFVFVIVSGWIEDSFYSIFSGDIRQNLVSLFKDAQSRYLLIALALTLFLLLLGSVFAILFWRKTFFYIEGDRLIYEKRTLMRRSARLPIASISTVNLQRNIFERLAGTAKIKVDLNSSFTSDTTDFIFVLREPLARRLRDMLILRRDELAAEAGEQSVFAPEREQSAYTVTCFNTAQVIRHTLFSLPFFQAALFFVLAFVLPAIGGEGATLDNLWRIALFLIAGGLLSAAVRVLNLLGYTVKRDNDNIYISYGALKKTSFSFNLRRINAVFVRQPLTARIFGLYSLEVAVVGMGNERDEKPILSLLVNKRELERIKALCVPDFACGAKPVHQHLSATVALIIRGAAAALISLPVMFLLPDPLSFLPLLLPVLVVLPGVPALRCKTLAFDENTLHYSRGVFSKSTLMFKYSDIQNVVISNGPMARKLGAGKMTLYILSSASSRTHATGSFEVDALSRVAHRVVEHRDSSADLQG